MPFFLRAKHWQLFLLFFGIPFVMQLFLMFNIFTTITSRRDPVSVLNDMAFFPVMMLFFIGTLFGWFWAVAGDSDECDHSIPAQADHPFRAKLTRAFRGKLTTPNA